MGVFNKRIQKRIKNKSKKRFKKVIVKGYMVYISNTSYNRLKPQLENKMENKTITTNKNEIIFISLCIKQNELLCKNDFTGDDVYECVRLLSLMNDLKIPCNRIIYLECILENHYKKSFYYDNNLKMYLDFLELVKKDI